MPRLTLVTEQCLAPIPGGTGRYTRDVARALAVAAPSDWTLAGVSAWHRNIGAARISGVAGPRRLPAGRRVLTALWERGLPPLVGGDVIHATTPLAPVRSLTPRLPGAPRGALVVTVHDAVPFTHPELLTERGAVWHRRMIAAAGREAAAIVVPTAAVATELTRHIEVAGRLEVIGEGVAQAFQEPASAYAVEAVRRRLRLPSRYLVSVGTLEPRKGLTTTIRALRHLPTDVELAVVGPTGWGDALGDIDPDLAARVRLLGRLSDDELAAVVTGATASVHASTSEGFGLPLVEAMSVGTPTVHTDIPVFLEVAGGAGLTFGIGEDANLAAQVARLLDSTQTAASARDAGLAVASHHRWEHAAQQLWDLYRELAARR